MLLGRIRRLERLLDDLAPAERGHLSLLCWCALGAPAEDIPLLQEDDQEAARLMLEPPPDNDPIELALARLEARANGRRTPGT